MTARSASPSSSVGTARSTAGSNDGGAVRAVHSRQSSSTGLPTADEPRGFFGAARTTNDLLRERDPQLEQLERERALPMPAEIKLPRGFGELVTSPLEEAIASLAARRHILGLRKKGRD